MTRIEKQTILAALSEYAFNCQRRSERAHKNREYETEREQRAQALNAAAIISYWEDVVNADCGAVTI